MELDTGAAVSLVSEKMFSKLWPNRSLGTAHTKLKAYSGEELKVVGVTQVDVEYNDQHVLLPLWVVAGSGPSLFEREWLKEIKINWQDIHRVHSAPLQGLLDKYETIFEDGLETLRGFQAKIHTDPDVVPKFCKPRPIPYAYCEKVENELNQLTDLGIIEPVKFSEWAAPIVPMLKSDGSSIRICGNYNITQFPSWMICYY